MDTTVLYLISNTFSNTASNATVSKGFRLDDIRLRAMQWRCGWCGCDIFYLTFLHGTVNPVWGTFLKLHSLLRKCLLPIKRKRKSWHVVEHLQFIWYYRLIWISLDKLWQCERSFAGSIKRTPMTNFTLLLSLETQLFLVQGVSANFTNKRNRSTLDSIITPHCTCRNVFPFKPRIASIAPFRVAKRQNPYPFENVSPVLIITTSITSPYWWKWVRKVPHRLYLLESYR